MFEIKGKVALITGGAGGVGLEIAKELLRNNLKGVAIVDFNGCLGEKAISDIRTEFGQGKAIFLKADVTDIGQLEDAFKKTVEQYQQLDIVFNNAGILNDSIWEKEIAINVNGVINCLRLALEKYLPAHKKGSDALILNTASISGLIPSAHVPIYSTTKHAVIGVTRSWGQPVFYDTFKVRIVAICPGVTITPMVADTKGKALGELYDKNEIELNDWPIQNPDFLAKETMEVVKYAPHGSIWVIEGGEPAYQYVFADKSSMKSDVISKYK